jgi:putative Mg2+ transporter-C (MgtC) family protein
MDNGLTVESLEIDKDEESLSLLVEVSKDDAIKVKNLIVGLSRVKGIRSAEVR